MKEQLKCFLKKSPALYRLVETSYYTLRFRHLKEYLLGTKAREREWAARSIAEGYWNNRDHPSKHFLVERIAAFSPISNILEVGCASGPNIYLLAKKFPQSEIVGIDVNSEAIKWGNAQFKREGISNVKLLEGKADELEQFQDKSFDVVFTNAILIYIGPDKINKVMKEMIRITRLALILMELYNFEPVCKDPYGLGIYYGGNWHREYKTLLKQFVSEEQIHVTKIPKNLWPAEPWKSFGAVIEVDME